MIKSLGKELASFQVCETWRKMLRHSLWMNLKIEGIYLLFGLLHSFLGFVTLTLIRVYKWGESSLFTVLPWMEGICLYGEVINFSSLSLLSVQLSPLKHFCTGCCLFHTDTMGEGQGCHGTQPQTALWLWTCSRLPPLGDVHGSCSPLNLDE